jgi:hypothetical protein
LAKTSVTSQHYVSTHTYLGFLKRHDTNKIL